MIKVIGKVNCPYCDKAKQLLKQQQIPFDYIDITDKPEEINKLKAQGIRSVPAVYQDDVYLGGFQELQQNIGFFNISGVGK